MEINKLIEKLEEHESDELICGNDEFATLLSNAAETIRLLQELAVDASNEKYKRLFDEVNHAE